MKKLKKYSNTIIGLCFVSLIVSCNSFTGIQLDEHKTEKYSLDPAVNTEGLKKTQYSIDSVRSLKFPQDDINEIGVDKIYVSNGRIYFLDSEITKSVYVFDHNGNLTRKYGERGRAKHEFIGPPNDFFVDINNKLHIFDKLGSKIIVFNEGGSVNDVIENYECSPHSIGLIGNNRYMMYFGLGHKEEDVEEETPSSLLLYDHNYKNYKKLMPSVIKCRCQLSEHSFFQDGDRLSHIPLFSDSVIVFRNDTIEKVVLFDFRGNILCKEKPELLKREDNSSLIFDYQGVLGLERYQETNFLIYLCYLHKMCRKNWLYIKKNKQFVNGNSLFDGISPYSYYFLNEDQIIAYVSKETVETLKQFYNNKDFKDNLAKSPEQIKDLMEGKIEAPALFFITIK